MKRIVGALLLGAAVLAVPGVVTGSNLADASPEEKARGVQVAAVALSAHAVTPADASPEEKAR